MTVADAVFDRLGSLTAPEATKLLGALRSEAVARCARDGQFFLQFVRTRDEADPERSVKPFPIHLEYIREIWHVLETQQRVVIAKSRQMLASWVACAFCCWWARFRENQAVYWQTQKWEDACEKIALAGGGEAGYLGRIQFIERHLPPFLQLKIRESEGKITYPNGSVVEALAGGADKIRGKVASVIVEDEFAFQPESKGVYTAVAPLIQKATKFIAISTPNGLDNVFAEIFHGIPVGRIGYAAPKP